MLHMYVCLHTHTPQIHTWCWSTSGLRGTFLSCACKSQWPHCCLCVVHVGKLYEDVIEAALGLMPRHALHRLSTSAQLLQAMSEKHCLFRARAAPCETQVADTSWPSGSFKYLRFTLKAANSASKGRLLIFPGAADDVHDMAVRSVPILLPNPQSEHGLLSIPCQAGGRRNWCMPPLFLPWRDANQKRRTEKIYVHGVLSSIVRSGTCHELHVLMAS